MSTRDLIYLLEGTGPSLVSEQTVGLFRRRWTEHMLKRGKRGCTPAPRDTARDGGMKPSRTKPMVVT